jgi:hypothetical protein
MNVAPLSSQITPALQSVDVGKSFTLNCSVSGGPILSLDWFHNGIKLVPNSRVRLLSRDVLQVTNVERKDAGIYQCLVTNEWSDQVQSSSQVILAGKKIAFK